MRTGTCCDGCNGTGVRTPASPSCRIDMPAGPWVVVEKCDSCDLYPDDLSAALATFRIAGWFRCESGAEHALAHARTRLRRRGRSRRRTK